MDNEQNDNSSLYLRKEVDKTIKRMDKDLKILYILLGVQSVLVVAQTVYLIQGLLK